MIYKCLQPYNRISFRFGTWKTGKGQESTDQVNQAISVGFSHIGMSFIIPFFSVDLSAAHALDTAQNYRNEAEAGVAIRESGLARDKIFITTKFSGLNGLDIPTSIRDSLRNVSLWSSSWLIHGSLRWLTSCAFPARGGPSGSLPHPWPRVG